VKEFRDVVLLIKGDKGLRKIKEEKGGDLMKRYEKGNF